MNGTTTNGTTTNLTTTNAAAGWHTDPHDQHLTRYWNGTAWSEERRWTNGAWVPSAPVRPVAPVAQVAPVAAPPFVPSAVAGSLPKLPMTAIALFGGAALAAIGVFLPWEQDTMGAEFLGAAAGTVTSGPTKVPAVALVLVMMALGIVALARPALRRRVSAGRSAGIAAITALLWVMPVLKVNALGEAASKAGGTMEYHLGLGWFITILGLLALSVGTVLAFVGFGAPKEAPAA